MVDQQLSEAEPNVPVVIVTKPQQQLPPAILAVIQREVEKRATTPPVVP